MFYDHLLGLYEKALPAELGWPDRLAVARQLGFDYVEISIDETDERLGRLYWDEARKRSLRRAITDEWMPLRSMCLSAHRRFPFGSADARVRDKAREIMRKAVEFADSVGIRVIQLAGYDVYYEPSTESSRVAFAEGMEWAARLAERYQVMLGMEIMDTPFMNSISKHLIYEDRIASPYYKVYPDIGNLTAWGNDVGAELRKGRSSMVAIHLKETLAVSAECPGQFRGVPFGSGCVDFVGFFRLIRELNYRGPFLLEMWTGTTGDDVAEIRRTLDFLHRKYRESCADENTLRL